MPRQGVHHPGSCAIDPTAISRVAGCSINGPAGFIRDSIGWHGTNKYCDLLQHLGRGVGDGGVRAVLQGAWIAYDKYREIYRRAETDPGFPRKSSTRPVVEDGSE